jgi:hypothetical protein
MARLPNPHHVPRTKSVHLKFFPGLSKKAAYPMHPNAIMREVQQLHNVSDRLEMLAEEHPLVSEALLTISGSVRNTATLLEVLVATKITPRAGLDPTSA